MCSASHYTKCPCKHLSYTYSNMHKFWSTQPVPQTKSELDIEGPIQPVQIADVRKIPYILPEEFKWVDLDVNDETQLDELYQLLVGHYVEDNSSSFRFGYSKPFLSWALT